jgi:hypothetical protein
MFGVYKRYLLRTMTPDSTCTPECMTFISISKIGQCSLQTGIFGLAEQLCEGKLGVGRILGLPDTSSFQNLRYFFVSRQSTKLDIDAVESC